MHQSNKHKNNIRVIAGKWRSRKISFPDLAGLRPTSDRTRETLFNWIQDFLPGENCLDLFAGSGALGIEALSRGAAHVTFIDNTKNAIDSIEENLLSLHATQFDLVCADARSWLQETTEVDVKQYGVVFLDPPFAQDYLLNVCQLLEEKNRLSDNALVYFESSSALTIQQLPGSWDIVKSKQAGAVHYALCKRSIKGINGSH